MPHSRAIASPLAAAPTPDTQLVDPKLSVVIPVYNERDNLTPLRGELVESLEAIGETFEIILVDDGSTDGTADVLGRLRASDPRLRVLTARRNAGQTAALAAGFAAARGEVVVTLDADLQNDPADIALLLAKLPDHDAVIGWRQSRRDPWLRRLSSRLANAMRNLVSGDDIIDTCCPLKAYRRKALAGIKMYDGMHRFLPTLLRMEGRRVCQVEVRHRPRRTGDSKYNVRNRLLRASADLLAVMWMKRRTLRYAVTEDGAPAWREP